MNKIKEHIYIILFLLLIIAFFTLKKESIGLPYYWDEAWVYAPALIEMSEMGPTLLPNVISTDLTRGHPLLFHFLGGCWIKFFGDSLFSNHMFAISISLALLLSVFSLLYKKDKAAAFFASALLTLQQVFLAQSSLLLPEMMLSLFVFLALFFYSERKTKLYILSASLAFMVKESALMIIPTLLLYELLNYILNKKTFFDVVKKSLVVAIPLIIPIIFFTIQYSIYGWVFFPEHMNYAVEDKLQGLFFSIDAYKNVFYYQSRFYLLIAFLSSIAIYFFLIKKNDLTIKELKYNLNFIFINFLFVFLFGIFYGFNFQSCRYLLVAVVLIVVSITYITSILLGEKPIIKNGILVLTSTIFIININNSDSVGDDSPNVNRAIKVHKKIVEYFENNKLHKKSIYANFVISNALNSDVSGYKITNDYFINAGIDSPEEREFYIFTNIEPSDIYKKKDSLKMELVQRFEDGIVWGEIYKRPIN